MSRSGVGSVRRVAFPGIDPAVDEEEQRQQRRDDQGGVRQQVNRGPEEIDAAQEAEEQRRIAQG